MMKTYLGAAVVVVAAWCWIALGGVSLHVPADRVTAVTIAYELSGGETNVTTNGVVAVGFGDGSDNGLYLPNGSGGYTNGGAGIVLSYLGDGWYISHGEFDQRYTTYNDLSGPVWTNWAALAGTVPAGTTTWNFVTNVAPIVTNTLYITRTVWHGTDPTGGWVVVSSLRTNIGAVQTVTNWPWQ